VVPSTAVREALLADLHEEVHGEFTVVRRDEGAWKPFSVPGAFTRHLSTGNGRVTFLLRLDPATRFPQHGHSGPEDCYVVAGELEVDGTPYGAGDFLHAAAGSGHGRIFSRSGCTLLLTIAQEDYSL
jgi:anti-sigma factor ChrR (cupin superfamily)